MVDDVVAETKRQLEQLQPADADGVRTAGRQIADFSEQLRPELAALRQFLHARVYRHERVNREREVSKQVVKALFARFFADLSALPSEWRDRAGQGPDAASARVICDYIAGMTDRFALREHARLCGGPGPK
jgi:dGTPase